MKKYFTLLCSLLPISLFLLIPLRADCYGNSYVKSSANGTGDGSSWTNAYTDLQVAIDAAQAGDTICVAAGTYLPTLRFRGDSLRNSTFYINKDITLFGGFSGEPGTEGTLEGRNPGVHETILSGDLGAPLDTLDNAFHVVFLDHVSDTMVLDGFVITGGNNFGASGLETYGSGMYLDGEAGRCSPVIANCVIRDNHADQSGGGIIIIAQFSGIARPTFTNCHILSNVGGGGGGIQGLVDDNGILSPTMMNCFFQGNTARTAQGSAISLVVHSSTSVVQMVNCVVTGNLAPFSSAFEIFLTGTGIAQPTIINSVFAGNNNGSMRVSSIGTLMSNVVVRNSIFWNNGFGHGLTTNNASTDVTNSIMQNGFIGNGNLSEDPKFVDTPSAQGTPHTDGDVHLLPGSPALEAGDNGAMPANIVIDADGKPRIVDIHTGLPGGTIDIGAFEYQQIISGTSSIFKAMDWSIYPNPANESVTMTVPNSDEDALVSLWNLDGIKLYSEKLPKGQQTATLNLNSCPEGIYLVSIQSNGYTDVRKLFVER